MGPRRSGAHRLQQKERNVKIGKLIKKADFKIGTHPISFWAMWIIALAVGIVVDAIMLVLMLVIDIIVIVGRAAVDIGFGIHQRFKSMKMNRRIKDEAKKQKGKDKMRNWIRNWIHRNKNEESKKMPAYDEGIRRLAEFDPHSF